MSFKNLNKAYESECDLEKARNIFRTFCSQTIVAFRLSERRIVFDPLVTIPRTVYRVNSFENMRRESMILGILEIAEHRS